MYPYKVQDRELKKDMRLELKGKDAVDLSLMTLPRVARGAPISSTVAKQPINPITSRFSEIARPVTIRLTPTKTLYTNLLDVGDIVSYTQMQLMPIIAPVMFGPYTTGSFFKSP